MLSLRTRACRLVFSSAAFGICLLGATNDLKEPITLASSNGVLDILMVAKAAPIKTLPMTPEGWVYEICKRPANRLDSCPHSNADPNYYGGTLLQLQKGDVLRIHLVNQLPPVPDSEHAEEPGHEFLELNPTNIHTHGMLVAPRKPTPGNPTYGDNIFVLTFNPQNGKPVMSPHMHSDVRYGFTDYEIKIPDSHPSGLFWFHPHAHGISLNQVTAGLGGIITVGNIGDYVCRNRACAAFVSKIATRHLIVKDTQLLPNGKLQTQEDPDFCAPPNTPGGGARHGDCDGQDTSFEQGPDYRGGKWLVTLNGQQYPTMVMKTAGGEIWRITNESGSATYDLKLWNPAQKQDMLFQVLSLDGVSVSSASGMSNGQRTEAAGGKFFSESCPAGIGYDGSADDGLCTRKLHMMPSARAEVWVAYRNARGYLAAPPKGAYAIFKTAGYQTGPSGDTWPPVDLAKVEFSGAFDPKMPSVLQVNGEAASVSKGEALANSMRAENQAVAPDHSCRPIAPGHMRRIFYGVPTDNPDAFGLAYEEVDQNGKVVGPPATDLIPFDPMYPTVCVPLGPGNSPVTERWQLVNVATEDHNFHVHQVKFRVLTNDEVAGTTLPISDDGKPLMIDNVPLPHADGVCGSNPPDDPSNPIADWRAGLCTTTPVTVEIPFTIAGDFVYHCHILEHEDGGMMARIRVRPNK